VRPAPGSLRLVHVAFQDAQGPHAWLPAPLGLGEEVHVQLLREAGEGLEAVWRLAFGPAETQVSSVPSDAELAAALSRQRVALAADLRARGWGIVDGFLHGAEADGAHLQLRRWWAEGRLEPWIKKVVCDEYVYMDTRGVVAPARSGWRGDVFVQGGPLAEGLRPAHRRVSRLIEELGNCVPELGGFLEVEDPMLAVFPGGGTQYARHFDSAGSHGRVCTAILYLNPFWRKEHGGELRMYPEVPGLAGSECQEAEAHGLLEHAEPEGGEASVTLAPVHGRLAVFLCGERNAHEVLRAWRPRMAVTWWIKRVSLSPC